MGDRAGEAAILHSLGMIHSQAGEKEKAMESFQNALRINQELADRPGEAGAFFQLGALAVQQDKMQEGLRLMALAAIVLRSIKSDDVKNVEPLVERLAAQLATPRSSSWSWCRRSCRATPGTGVGAGGEGLGEIGPFAR